MMLRFGLVNALSGPIYMDQFSWISLLVKMGVPFANMHLGIKSQVWFAELTYLLIVKRD